MAKKPQTINIWALISAEERREFEKGIKNRDKHFSPLRVEPKSFLEKIVDTFGFSARKKRKVDRKVAKRFEKDFKDLPIPKQKKKPARLGSGNVPRLEAPKKTKQRSTRKRRR